jgi:hypothetical protein
LSPRRLSSLTLTKGLAFSMNFLYQTVRRKNRLRKIKSKNKLHPCFPSIPSLDHTNPNLSRGNFLTSTLACTAANLFLSNFPTKTTSPQSTQITTKGTLSNRKEVLSASSTLLTQKYKILHPNKALYPYQQLLKWAKNKMSFPMTLLTYKLVKLHRDKNRMEIYTDSI